jgi:hypothetical protein
MVFKPSDKERAITYLNNLLERKRWVKIEHITESKTLSQNAYLWLVFTHIAFETGNSKEDIYQYYLSKFPVKKEIDLNGVINLIPVTLSGFTKEQATNFIENVTSDARIEGFDIPNPEDKKAVEMYQYYKTKGLI